MGSRGRKKAKLQPYIGIKKEVRIKGLRRIVLFQEFTEKHPEIKISAGSFYNFINGVVCTKSRELIEFMAEKLEMSIEEMMVRYIPVGVRRSEFERNKLDSPENIRKKQELEDIEKARKMYKDAPEIVSKVFKDEDGTW